MVGPTAAGKTDLAVELARVLDADVLSVDSMQIYRGMDIGTAKPRLTERRGVVHHMIDVAEPEDEFSAAEFRSMARGIMESSDRPIVICGGSGLHFRSVVDPMTFAPTEPELRAELEAEELADLVDWLINRDPDAGDVVDLANKRRVVRAVEVTRLTGETPSSRTVSDEADELKRYVSEIDFVAIGVDPGDSMEDRVRARLTQMRINGLVDEVAGLRDRLGRTASSAVGYRELLSHMNGELSEDEAFEAIERNTLKLARKQRTWFQRDPRIRWIPWGQPSERLEAALEILR